MTFALTMSTVSEDVIWLVVCPKFLVQKMIETLFRTLLCLPIVFPDYLFGEDYIYNERVCNFHFLWLENFHLKLWCIETELSLFGLKILIIYHLKLLSMLFHECDIFWQNNSVCSCLIYTFGSRGFPEENFIGVTSAEDNLPQILTRKGLQGNSPTLKLISSC